MWHFLGILWNYFVKENLTTNTLKLTWVSVKAGMGNRGTELWECEESGWECGESGWGSSDRSGNDK